MKECQGDCDPCSLLVAPMACEEGRRSKTRYRDKSLLPFALCHMPFFVQKR